MAMNPRLLRPLARFQAPAGDPFATLVSTRSAGNVSGSARSTTGYIKVEWWDSTTNVYGAGNANNSITWSKAAGGAGEKTIRIYPSDASGNLSGSLALLSCPSNSLTSLNVSGLTSLMDLSCGLNSLTSLNVSGLTALTTLACFGNSLTSLNVSGLTSLTTLACFGNSLTSVRATAVSLGFWKNKKHAKGSQPADLSSNFLDAAALDQFYTDLDPGIPGASSLNVAGNPGTAEHDPTIATNKGYVVFD